MPRAKRANDSSTARNESFRTLPSVDRMIADHDIQAASELTDELLVDVVRQVLTLARFEIQSGLSIDPDTIRDRVTRALKELQRPRLTPVINGTGVIVHTNLGRAPVSRATSAAMAAAAEHYVPVEIDLAIGDRGDRMSEISALMRLLTGAEATLVVNNNAAAVLLVLSALAAGREVIVSRGEAVEIGGGFRVPDVLKQSGATLIEVGATNRTHTRDYADAVTEQTALFLKVHPSNFAMIGFTTSVSVAELAAMDLALAVPIIEDLGSGALLDTSRFGMRAEPTIGESLAAGAALVTASGDKLLGGPQAGIIAGREDLIDRVARHPLARAVRADKTILAGLAATLRHYTRGDAEREIPVWRMISATVDSLECRAREIAAALERRGVVVGPVVTESTVGGGSLPGQILASWGLYVAPASGISLNAAAKRLRYGNPPVIARVHEDQVLLDLRTVSPEDDHELTNALIDVFGPTRG